MDQRLSLIQQQNLSLQLKVSVDLDKGLDEVHELVDYYKENFYSVNFRKDVKKFFLSSNKKEFFSNKISNNFFLKQNIGLLESSIDYVIKFHGEKFRDSGNSVLAHDFGTGFLLSRLGFPKEVVVAGILHDCVEDSKDKKEVMNDLYKINPFSSFYVYSVSAPDIGDVIKRDEELYNKISVCSTKINNLFPKALKCLDTFSNLYDVEFLKANKHFSAFSRQLRFLSTSRKKIIPFAKEIDSKGYIPIMKRKTVFSLEEYANDFINEKLSLVKSRQNYF